jgi:N-acetylglutamate synthase-like GNAT family acetyltransferase
VASIIDHLIYRSMSEVIIETYTEIYKNRIADLILNIQNEEFGIPITLDQQPDLNEIPKFYQAANGNFWIAKIEDKLIGTIALLDIGNGKTALRKMFVDRNYRGKEFGIGQKLLNTLFAWAKQKSITQIYLGTTEKFIGAQRFYEKNGFLEIQKQTLPKEFPVMDVDVKFYKFSV